MAIPLKYNFRNLLRRWKRTGLTVLGVALVVFVEVLVLAFAKGLHTSTRVSGDPRNVIILSAKAGANPWFSDIDPRNVFPLETLEYIAEPKEILDEEGEYDHDAAYLSPEVQYMTELRGAEPGSVVTVRGVEPETGMLVNDDFVSITAGGGPYDNYSVIISTLVAAKLGWPKEKFAIGRTIHFKDQDWTITGHFKAPNTMMDSEIWCHHDNLMEKFNRTSYAMVKIRARSVDDVPKLIASINNNQRYQDIKAYRAVDFYKKYADGLNKFNRMAIITAIVIAIGGVFTGINTMYTAVVGRIREIGMLQVIGFSKRSVVSSFLAESLMISVVGGVIGCLAGYLCNGAVLSLTWFAFALKVDLQVLAIGFATAIVIGVVGAFFPALRGVRMRMVDAMRYN